MNKNTANIYRFVIVDIIGQGLTGLTPSITLAKDSATTFTATTNNPSEVSSTDAPGLYEIVLTATECNCDTLTIRVTLPTGQAPAILDVVQMQGESGGGATPQEIWEYAGGRTVTNTIPTAADNATAVWGASSRTLTNLNIQSELTTYGAAKTTDLTGLATSQDITNSQAVIIGAMPTTAGLATESSVANIATLAGAIKAKTDNLPDNPAAVTDVTAAQAAIISAMPDISNLATATDLSNAEDTIIGNIVSAMPDISGLSTFNAATDTVTIDATQAAGMATADVSGLATATAQAAQTAAISKLDSSVLHWAATVNTLTLYDSNNATLAEYTLTRDGGGNITAIAPKE